MRKFSIAVLLGTSFFVTSCGLNMKPEHQQAYDSFDKRRAPRDNQIASTGGLSDERSVHSNFSPFTGSVVGQSSEKGINTPASRSAPTTSESIKDAINSKVKSTTSSDDTPTAPDTPILDRLKQKFSWMNASDNQFASARIVPVENQPHLQVAAIGANIYNGVGQGDGASNYSYYDLADEIDAYSDSYRIEDSKLIQLAKADKIYNASAPLVDVEDAPSYEEIRSEANFNNKPEIKDIPASPKRVVEHQKKHSIPQPENCVSVKESKPEKIEVRAMNKMQAPKEYVQKAEFTQEDNISHTIADRSAKVIYLAGSPVVTGTLGILKK